MFTFSLESFIGSFSFVVLFLIMIFYWFQALFHIFPKFNEIIVLFTLSANFSLITLLIIRWLGYKHFPLSNLYESLIFLSWSFNLIQLLFLYWKFNNKQILVLIGTILSPMALFTNSFATFSLPKNMQKAQALVPALQSNWLMMHVTVMMLSYTALLFGSLLSISFLIINWVIKKQKSTQLFTNIENNTNTIYFSDISQYSVETASLSNESNKNINTTASLWIKKTGNNKILNYNALNELTKILDNLSYRVLGIGFPLLTIGILSGAVWANEAWGSYWSWDPKETWAFITWLVFAMYLHGRIIKKWEDQKAAIVASLGFFIIWICYLGVNILGTGLHSYGWLK